MSATTTPRLNTSRALTDVLHLPPFGAESGYNTEGDVLVNSTADGVDLNVLWSELAAVLQTWNNERSAIAQLLSYVTTNTADAIPQSTADESFDLASEFGEPTALRAPSSHLLLGYTFDDYDKASRFTWKFLRQATAEQVRATTNVALTADNKLVNGLVLDRLFDPTPRTNEWGHTCYGLWNADGVIPPSWLGKSFDASHSHYLVSGSATLDSGDVDAAIKHVEEHGYGTEPTSQLVLLCNPQEAEIISTFKAGVENENEQVAHYDYIPSAGAPPYLLPSGETIQGAIAPAVINGLKIQGSYGPVWVIQSYYVPAGYFAVVASYGAGSPSNPIGLRQHTNPAYQGLRLIPGYGPYPLQDSFFARGIGLGTRHRGGACVVQVKASGEYDAPTIAR